MKCKLVAVEYLNTLPYIYGLQQHPSLLDLEIILAPPAECARLLKTDSDLDLALIPVGSFSDFDELYVLDGFGIACDGPVDSVCVYSNKNWDQVYQISLDPSSRTSNLLLQLLLDQQLFPNPIQVVLSSSDYDAKLVIGDEALKNNSIFSYRKDLGEEWKKYTGFPFVFACWASQKKLNQELITELKQLFQKGINSLTQMIYEKNLSPIQANYLQTNIHYGLDEHKKQGLSRFLKLVQNQTKIHWL